MTGSLGGQSFKLDSVAPKLASLFFLAPAAVHCSNCDRWLQQCTVVHCFTTLQLCPVYCPVTLRCYAMLLHYIYVLHCYTCVWGNCGTTLIYCSATTSLCLLRRRLSYLCDDDDDLVVTIIIMMLTVMLMVVTIFMMMVLVEVTILVKRRTRIVFISVGLARKIQ